MSGRGWRADISPDSCPAAAFDFDFIAGASGKTGSDSFKGISKIIFTCAQLAKSVLKQYL